MRAIRLILVTLIVCLMGASSPALGQETSPIDELVADLEGGDLEKRRVALLKLKELGPQAAEALPVVIKCLDDRDVQVWANSIQTLAAMGAAADEAVPVLLQQLKGSTGQRHYRISFALGRVGTQRIDQLMEVLADSDARRRAGVAKALGWMGTQASPAVGPLVDCLSDPDEDVSTSAAESLWRIGEPAVTALTAQCAAEDEKLRQRAVESLGRMGPQAVASTDVLLKGAQDVSPQVRSAALNALALVARDDSRVISQLRQTM